MTSALEGQGGSGKIARVREATGRLRENTDKRGEGQNIPKTYQNYHKTNNIKTAARLIVVLKQKLQKFRLQTFLLSHSTRIY